MDGKSNNYRLNIPYSCNQVQSPKGTLHVIDMSGREVLQTILPGDELMVDLTLLSDGVYLFHIAGNHGITTRKVIVNRSVGND